MHIITFCSFKGGTAKTSTALSIGACLAKMHKKRVLLVDFDSQANLSIGLGIGPDCEQTFVQVLQGSCKVQDIIQETSVKDLFLIPANAYLDGIERTTSLCSDAYAHERLRDALASIADDYDYCFVDTPPSLGWLTQSAFFASDYNLICAIPEAYSVIGLRRLKEFQELIQKHHPIELLGVVLSLWDTRSATNPTFLEEISASFPQKLLHTKIRRDVAVSHAVLHGKPVIEYAPKCRASIDYQQLTKELLDLLKKPQATLKNLSRRQPKTKV